VKSKDKETKYVRRIPTEFYTRVHVFLTHSLRFSIDVNYYSRYSIIHILKIIVMQDGHFNEMYILWGV
jgi:hypothetical protein